MTKFLVVPEDVSKKLDRLRELAAVSERDGDFAEPFVAKMYTESRALRQELVPLLEPLVWKIVRAGLLSYNACMEPDFAKCSVVGFTASTVGNNGNLILNGEPDTWMPKEQPRKKAATNK